jgi:hypothetical protein
VRKARTSRGRKPPATPSQRRSGRQALGPDASRLSPRRPLCFELAPAPTGPVVPTIGRSVQPPSPALREPRHDRARCQTAYQFLSERPRLEGGSTRCRDGTRKKVRVEYYPRWGGWVQKCYNLGCATTATDTKVAMVVIGPTPSPMAPHHGWNRLPALGIPPPAREHTAAGRLAGDHGERAPILLGDGSGIEHRSRQLMWAGIGASPARIEKRSGLPSGPRSAPRQPTGMRPCRRFRHQGCERREGAAYSLPAAAHQRACLLAKLQLLREQISFAGPEIQGADGGVTAPRRSSSAWRVRRPQGAILYC